jgi:hypothetical protein
LAEAERLRQSLLADAGEVRPIGLRMILSVVSLTPPAWPTNRLQGLRLSPPERLR